MVNNKADLEKNLKSILDKEILKIKSSVEGYIKEDKSKGISQMIGRRYGHMWQIMVIEVFKHSKKVELGDKVLYKDYVSKWIDSNVESGQAECCIKNSKNVINKFLAENTGTDQQDLCDFTISEKNIKYGIDTKVRFVSNDSNTVREIADSARHLKFMGYEPILLFRKNREDSLRTPLNRFEKEGWKLLCAEDAMKFIADKTEFNLDEWINKNVDIWAELKKYQDELIKLRFGEENWKF